MCSNSGVWSALRNLWRRMTFSTKGFQSGASTVRTGEDSENTALTATPHGSRPTEAEGGAEGGALPAEVHVPTVRPLDTTTDTSYSATLDDSVTPRPAQDYSVDSTPRPAPEQPGTPSSAADSTPRPAPEGESSAERKAGRQEEDNENDNAMADNNNDGSGDAGAPPVTQVQVYDEDCKPSTTEDQKPRPKLTASNSGADIMLGLETDEGQSAEVEIDAADQEELIPETEAPKGRVRKASITDKVIKTKASEAMAAMIKEEAETRQRDFEKLLDEHAELVQEISRTPSSENLIQGERDH